MARIKEEDKEEPAPDLAGPSSSNGIDATPSAEEATSTGVAVAATAAVSAVSAVVAATSAASVRTTGRVKKPKQVYDPSDNYVSRASNRSSVGIVSTTASPVVASSGQSPPANVPVAVATEAADSLDSNPSPTVPVEKQAQSLQLQQIRNFDTCQKCNKSEPKRGSGHKSNFLTCKSCMQKWHFPCLPVAFENLTVARKKYKCDKCRYCCVCNIRARDLPICSNCADSYHLHCNNPALKSSAKPTSIDPKWKCSRCARFYENNNNDNATTNNSSSSGGEQTSPVAKKSNAGRKKRVNTEPPAQKKPAKVEKLEKAVKLKKPQKQAKTEKSEKPEKPNKPEKAGKPVNLEKPEMRSSLDITIKVENSAATDDNASEQSLQITNKEEDNQPVTDPLKTEEELEEESTHNDDSIPTTSSLTVEGAEAISKLFEELIVQPVSSWTVEQVVVFISKYYPKEANVFRYQDIDGASLLLLTRHDVIGRFGLKLGPALRVYELVLSLQSKVDDVAIGWME